MNDRRAEDDHTSMAVEEAHAEPSSGAAAPPAAPTRRRLRPWRLVGLSGITAVGVKELRGRMRGRRAFAFLTFYLTVLTGFAWMIASLQERSFQSNAGLGSASQASQIGQSIFIALLLLETLLVTILAPAYTASAISLEREKQTLDLLAVTPISSLAIVLGKLLSALTFVFLLIVASIPLTAIVFVYGGVAPDDVIRGYAVLSVTAVGLGAIGLFCSALVRRTQAATIITYFIVLALSLGTAFVYVFWNAVGQDEFGIRRSRPPEALLWFNPFVSQADVICGTVGGYATDGTCGALTSVTGRTVPVVGNDVIGGPAPISKPLPAVGVAVPGNNFVVNGTVVTGDVGQLQQPVAAPDETAGLRDAFWPRAAVAWLVLAVVLVLLSVQLVMPTRRWHLRRPASRLEGGGS